MAGLIITQFLVAKSRNNIIRVNSKASGNGHANESCFSGLFFTLCLQPGILSLELDVLKDKIVDLGPGLGH